MPSKSYKSVVMLTATDVNRQLVEQLNVSYDMYYDGGVPVVDSSEYRAKKGIRHLSGRIYDSRGVLEQEFDNQYLENGDFSKCRAVHADGTVVET